MEMLLVHDILPLIPQEGSVGASGDLTPLSYIAGTLVGERTRPLRREDLRGEGKRSRPCGLPVIRLRPKEGLAMMNGTGRDERDRLPRILPRGNICPISRAG